LVERVLPPLLVSKVITPPRDESLRISEEPAAAKKTAAADSDRRDTVGN
jgi:hypothetical protein